MRRQGYSLHVERSAAYQKPEQQVDSILVMYKSHFQCSHLSKRRVQSSILSQL